jgi:ABC-type Mn2+/Zn2+ transport system ATPase subunit
MGRENAEASLAVEVHDCAVLRGARPVLGPLALQVRIGQRIVVAGPNGAGKTTLLMALLGLLPITGEVHVFGLQVGSRRWRRQRSRVGWVNQETVAAAFPIAAWEVVEIGVSGQRLSRGERGRRIREAMDLTGCGNLRNRPYAELSGGEKQRVGLARCLAQAPDLLLLDEPTASLDPSAKEAFVDHLTSLADDRGLTVVMVTHERNQIEGSGWSTLHLAEGVITGGDS